MGRESPGTGWDEWKAPISEKAMRNADEMVAASDALRTEKGQAPLALEEETNRAIETERERILRVLGPTKK
jgi:hypothetical protein